jgi:hypothetical protein
MQLVNSSEVFRQHLKIIDRLFWLERRLPDVVLKESLPFRVFIEEALFSGSFFDDMKAFVTAIGEDRFFLAVIVPNPATYFDQSSEKFPIVEISAQDQKEDYFELLHQFPADSSYGPLGHSAQVTLFYSESANWGIHIDNHDLELGVAGFADARLKTIFVSTFGSKHVFNARDAIEQLLKNVFINVPGGVPDDLRDQLIKNYQIR